MKKEEVILTDYQKGWRDAALEIIEKLENLNEEADKKVENLKKEIEKSSKKLFSENEKYMSNLMEKQLFFIRGIDLAIKKSTEVSEMLPEKD